MKPTLLALAAALLLSAPPADDLRYQPAEGLTLTRELERKYELTLEDISVEMNGQPLDVEGEMELTDELHVVVVDLIESAGRGRPAKLVRTYETLAGKTAQSADGEESVRERESELEGKKVAFTWDEDEESYDVDFAGPKADAALLEDLEEDLDLRAFLPKGAVDAGDSWEIDASALAVVVRPGGDLKLKVSEGEDPSSELGPDFVANLEGEIRATYRGTRTVDDVELHVIAIESEVETHGGDEESQRIDLAFELKGELLWDGAEGRAHSMELRGPMSVRVNESRSGGRMGDQEIHIVQRITLEGSAAFRLEVRR